MDHSFKVGEKYRNRWGTYKVLAIDGQTLKVRYEDGSPGRLSIDSQARILEEMAREEKRPKQKKRKSAKRPGGRRKTSTKQAVSQQDDDSASYWLWVTTKDYYEEDGEDAQWLDPSLESDPSGSWTCDRRTRKGDLVFLYRTTPKKDIAYMMQATSDAYSISDYYAASNKKWDYACDFRVLKKLQNPITIQDLRDDKLMRDWPVLRAQFRRRSFAITPEYWHRLNQLAGKNNKGFEGAVETLRKTVVKDIASEAELEEALAKDLGLLSRFGYDLELYADRRTGKNGKQFVCSGKGGRIDLLCYDRNQRQYVVIELKNVKASQHTIGQIFKYIGWVRMHISEGAPVQGLVISRGTEPEFELGLEGAQQITSLDLTQLGFR